ncbi:MAG: 3-phosphoshikimate 1-carboxyvinyltransferase [Chloroflexi bacterium]|nr:3-phosphoshikimate 1-carboxyvinyltransferase [Chloroflexota bacterium]
MTSLAWQREGNPRKADPHATPSNTSADDAPVRIVPLPARTLQGEIRVPNDKSICHRALMLGGLASGRSIVHGLLNSADVLSTARCLRALGVGIEMVDEGTAIIDGRGEQGLAEPGDVLDAGNSGTTVRLLSGVLAGQDFYSVLTGDASLRRRPMARIAQPLAQMGATILGRDANRLLPLSIVGGNLRSIGYRLPVASAQVKSCILLAGLFAEGETTVEEPSATRDHTERMLSALGVPITWGGGIVRVRGRSVPSSFEISVPGDFSSAAFFLAAAAILPDSELVVHDVGVNPTRTGFLGLLRSMGADITMENERIVGGEPVADLRCRGSQLRGGMVQGEMVPSLIDELPVAAVVATQAEGQTVVRDAQELRVKESDRIRTIVVELSRLGARISETDDGFVVEGPTPLRGAYCHSYGDHRIAMSLAVAGLVASGDVTIDDPSCADVSFPGFFEALGNICREPPPFGRGSSPASADGIDDEV